MQTENIVLLPQNISWTDKLDIPYTNLKVGDKIFVIIRNKAKKTETTVECRVGGFLSEIPLPTTTMVSNGFGVILSKERLKLMEFSGTGVKHISIFSETDNSIEKRIKKLSEKFGYELIVNTDKESKVQEMGSILFRTIFIILCTTIFTIDFHLIFSKIIEQKQEFTLLYKIGVSKKQLLIIFLSENVFPVIVAIILGNSVGMFWLYLDITGESGNIFPFSYLIPWRYIIVANLIMAIAILLAVGGTYRFIKGVDKNADNKGTFG